jgi:ferric-dicitrate binding protein FerR (iron transport regulator)
MSYQTRKRHAADRNPTNGECAHYKEEWNEFSEEAKEHWEEAKAHWNEFSAKFSEKFSAHVNTKGSEQRENGYLLDVKLPNGRQFSFTLGHVIIAGLLIWWLPFNWIVLGGLIWLAIAIGSNHDEKPKRDAADKPKRVSKELTDGEDDFEIYRV